MVLELMEGGELFDQIRKKISFTEMEASDITKQVASAIFHIHSQNIAHRDLKPENLLIKDNSDNIVVKLTDFGFAKIDKGNLVTPQFTPYYVSPQVLEAQRFHRAQKMGNIPIESEPYTYDKVGISLYFLLDMKYRSCDIWSLGVIIYIMLCGYPPFYSENPRKQLSQGMKRRIMEGEYDFPAPEWSKISDLAKDVIKRMLVIDSKNRMTIHELIKHPWLNAGITLATVLKSPQKLMLEDSFEKVVIAHSAMLADLRVPDDDLILNPNAIEKNPIILKRRKAQELVNKNVLLQLATLLHYHTVISIGMGFKALFFILYLTSSFITKSVTCSLCLISSDDQKSLVPIETSGIKALRDMVAFLYMPPLDKIVYSIDNNCLNTK
ncbi:MAP kinase-activated protein kinase 5 isoform X1 [Hydra vulgaris]|uniref:MAP kinase-activated protein kinase 5 isoform X1 n=1 Tax=Hydra vulgaris TaxID=6087 RepID=UPI0032EA80F1